jgi:hypothetical protein
MVISLWSFTKERGGKQPAKGEVSDCSPKNNKPPRNCQPDYNMSVRACIHETPSHQRLEEA